MRLFSKILIANRGEIAVRIIRTCRELGIATVAVYSEADRLALHTRLADEAYGIGPPAASESYLDQEKLIGVARRSGAEAIHPGYGFLAENPEFASAVEKAGLVFIGPPASAMSLMGDKTAARESMQAAGVPIVPGLQRALKDAGEAQQVAEELGYPVLLKAAAGGGGKGMRIVASAEEMPASFRAACSESESAFGDGRVYLEKYLERPRHIEFQILADRHGGVIHLGERECSIQRRHQKVIEEAPSVLLDETMRQEMGLAAVRAARACGYVGAGTIEFMVDRNRRFYFLEMNTRLQVEHPVTEMVTGLDLVAEQIRIAAGEPLALDQEQVQLRGHAIECRIYAEAPENNFLPSTGVVTELHGPGGPGIREDVGIYPGGEVSVYYDPLISKLITWGPDREAAINRMRRALREYRLSGVASTIPFCLWVMEHPRFVAGDFDTHFVQQEFRPGTTADEKQSGIAALGAVLYETLFRPRPAVTPSRADGALSPWKLAGRRATLER
jgi:acetyl-CoA carboxylase biotin carboxylase subunit